MLLYYRTFCVFLPVFEISCAEEFSGAAKAQVQAVGLVFTETASLDFLYISPTQGLSQKEVLLLKPSFQSYQARSFWVKY